MALFRNGPWLWAATPALLMTLAWNPAAPAADPDSTDMAGEPIAAGAVAPAAYRMARGQYSPQYYMPCPPQATQPAPGPAGVQPGAQPAPPTPSPSDRQPFPGIDRAAIEAEQFGGLGGQLAVNDAPGGYLDSAIVGNLFRFRFDAAYNDFRPDRAEFIYAKCGCFREAGVDPNAKGPGPLPERKIDYQEFRFYLEGAITDRFSVFGELPIRLLDADINPDHQGIGDVEAGFKYALVACPDRYLTAQLRVYAPTGDSFRGLGTDHTSLEPGILYYRQLSPRLALQAELKDWIPIGGSDFAGNVLRWGAGLGYDVIQPCTRGEGGRLTAVAEIVGWNVLSGKESSADFIGARSAAGETIVNLKVGPRVTWQQNSLYCGWGHALTDDAWYKDMLRVEFSRSF